MKENCNLKNNKEDLNELNKIVETLDITNLNMYMSTGKTTREQTIITDIETYKVHRTVTLP